MGMGAWSSNFPKRGKNENKMFVQDLESTKQVRYNKSSLITFKGSIHT